MEELALLFHSPSADLWEKVGHEYISSVEDVGESIRLPLADLGVDSEWALPILKFAFSIIRKRSVDHVTLLGDKLVKRFSCLLPQIRASV